MQLTHDKGARAARTGLSLTLALGLACAFPLGGIAATAGGGMDAADMPVVSTPAGLVKEQGHWRYYKKTGELLTASWKKISGRRYYFDAAGNAEVGAAKIGGERYVFDAKGRLFSPKKTRFVKVGAGIFYVNKKGRPAAKGWLLKKSSFYYVRKTGRVVTDTMVDGIRLGSDGRSKDDYASRAKLAAVKRIQKLTKPSMSRKEKLNRCFKWLFTLPFSNATTPGYIGKRGWVQRRSIEVQKSDVRECWGHACAFAMMAYELGYKPTVRGRQGRHGYVIMNGRRWDSIYAKPYISNTSSWKVVSWRDVSPQLWGKYARKSSAKKTASSKSSFTGFKTVKGNLRYYKAGKLLKKSWLKVGKKSYWFDGKGNAATGSVKAKRSGKTAYWVFNAKHALCTGGGTRVVKVNGVSYRVKKNGEAAAGWTSGKTALYLASGELATGVRVVDGGLAAFSEKGAYDAELTVSLRSAAAVNGDPAGLLALLGEPKAVTETPNSCYAYLGMQGSDVAYSYAHVTVNVFAAEDGNAYLESVV